MHEKKKLVDLAIWILGIVLLFGAMVSSAGAAALFQATETPTPTNSSTPTPSATSTFQPLFETATPRVVSNYECLDVLPTDFGVLTPYPDWSFQCDRCGYAGMYAATQSALNNPTFEAEYTPLFPTNTVTLTPTQTLTPTGGPTATASSTPAADGIFVDDDFNEEFQKMTLSVSNNGGNFSWAYDVDSMTMPVNYPGLYFAYEYQVNIISIIGDDYEHYRSASTPNDVWGNKGSGEGAFDDPTSPSYWVAVVPWSNSAAYIAAGTTREAVWGTEANYNDWLAYYYSGVNVETQQVFLKDDPSIMRFGYTAGVNRGIGGPAKYIEVDFYPVRVWYFGQPPTQPTATPVGLSTYCHQVDGLPPGYEFPDPVSDDIVTLPTPIIGEQQCFIYNGLDVELPFTIWGVQDIVIPPISICLVPIFLGTLSIFNGFISLNMDVVLFAMAAITLFRWFIRS